MLMIWFLMDLYFWIYLMLLNVCFVEYGFFNGKKMVKILWKNIFNFYLIVYMFWNKEVF